MPKLIKLLGYIFVCEAAGVIGSLFTFSSIQNWYQFLNKPAFSPPNWIFGPVWTVLYALMGIALFRVVEKKTKNISNAVKLFWWQLGFNFIWTPVFFGARNLGGAFLIIAILFVLIVMTIKSFAKIDRISAYLLAPYLVWVGFASILNFSVWILN